MKILDGIIWITGTIGLALIGFLVGHWLNAKTDFDLELIKSGIFIVYVKLCLAANRSPS